ncbi:hypothetical protein FHS27_002422 [Rhodopirellula rubra]|uniref:Uncharacterized protein n=1 Tax=Aporhodopirellula rubra TaxID=980271 RepID=A0A7W5DY15_9BACT|nr:hypothetical protein [Aporhodopirellula rubra]
MIVEPRWGSRVIGIGVLGFAWRLQAMMLDRVAVFEVFWGSLCDPRF